MNWPFGVVSKPVQSSEASDGAGPSIEGALWVDSCVLREAEIVCDEEGLVWTLW